MAAAGVICVQGAGLRRELFQHGEGGHRLSVGEEGERKLKTGFQPLVKRNLGIGQQRLEQPLRPAVVAVLVQPGRLLQGRCRRERLDRRPLTGGGTARLRRCRLRRDRGRGRRGRRHRRGRAGVGYGAD